MRELHREPFMAAVSVRHVHARDHRLAGAYCKKAPLVLGSWVVEQVDHRFEPDSAEDADAGVAWSTAEVPDALVAEPLELAQRQLALRRPDLLQADQLRSLLRDPLKQTAADGGADAVHVQRDNAHERDDANGVSKARNGRWPDSLVTARSEARVAFTPLGGVSRAGAAGLEPHKRVARL